MYEVTPIDIFLLQGCDHFRSFSFDPSSKIGTAVFPFAGVNAYYGWNHHPAKIPNTMENWNRPLKYRYVIHAERDAIYATLRAGISCSGATLYMVGMGPPTTPCIECAKTIVEVGIKRIISSGYKAVEEHWLEELKFTENFLTQCGVELVEVDYEKVKPTA